VLGLILGILLISQFWTLANDLYDALQAKRPFGFIGGGASLGGALGAAIAALVVEKVRFLPDAGGLSRYAGRQGIQRPVGRAVASRSICSVTRASQCIRYVSVAS
jgi:ATP/ADP translocase